MKFRHAFFLLGLAASASLFSSGCGGAGAQDQREERDSLFQKAQARKEARDVDGAIDLFNKALERKPGLALAHLELALIYDQDKEDYVRAIYHYQRYLELRPKAEKREIVDEHIRVDKMLFAASLPDKPSESVREIAMLKQEIGALKEQLEAMQGVQQAARVKAQAQAPASVAAPPAGGKPAATSSVAQVSAKGTPAPLQPAPPQAAIQSYVVAAGDTLSRIAGKVYNDPSKWEQIYNANRATLPSPQSLKAGQTLVIPKENR